MNIRTRKEYLSGIVSHSDYYGQFITEDTTKNLLQSISIIDICKSRDEHMNDIPLIKWDTCRLSCNLEAIKEAGESLTPAVKVCILKETARREKNNPLLK